MKNVLVALVAAMSLSAAAVTASVVHEAATDTAPAAEAAVCYSYYQSGTWVSRKCVSVWPYNKFRVKAQCWVDNYPYAPSTFYRYGSWTSAGTYSGASCYVAGRTSGISNRWTQFSY